MDESVILYTTWPDAQTAEAVAAEAVAERLAACANILAPMLSIYRWEGALERAGEIPMTLKTTAETAPALRDFVVERHPYDVPCVLCFRVDASASAAAYLDWLGVEVQPKQPDVFGKNV